MPEIFVGNHFLFQKISDMEKFLDKTGGYQSFSGKIFPPGVPKNLVGGTLVFQNYSGPEKFLDIRVITIFLNFFCLDLLRKIFGGALLCFKKFLVQNRDMDKSGGVTRTSGENLMSLSPEKIRR